MASKETTRGRRYTNKHHCFYPASAYQSSLEVEFRELPCNIVELQVDIHNLLHHLSEPPDKPLIRDMVKAVRNHEMGRCPCRQPRLKPRRG